MSLEEAVRRVLDHGRNHKGLVAVPLADFDALVGSYKANGGVPSGLRDPENDSELRRIFESGYV